jgi:hypothetical protein
VGEGCGDYTEVDVGWDKLEFDQISYQFMDSKYIFLFLAVVVFMVGCKEKEPETYYVNPEMLRYCWFPVGSYWIYEEDSVPGSTDSVYITYRKSGVIEDEGYDYPYEHYAMEMEIFGQYHTHEISVHLGYDNATNTILEERNRDLPFDDTNILLFSNSNGENVLGTDYDGYSKEVLDSVPILGTVYYDVIKVWPNQLSGTLDTAASYWCRGIGLIRREVVGGNAWNLKRYEIHP